MKAAYPLVGESFSFVCTKKYVDERAWTLSTRTHKHTYAVCCALVFVSIYPSIQSDPGSRIPPSLLVDGNLFRALSSSRAEPQQFMCFWNTFVSFALSASNYDVSHEPTRPWLILIPFASDITINVCSVSVYTAYGMYYYNMPSANSYCITTSNKHSVVLFWLRDGCWFLVMWASDGVIIRDFPHWWNYLGISYEGQISMEIQSTRNESIIYLLSLGFDLFNG